MKVIIHSRKRLVDDLFNLDEINLQFERFNGDLSSIVRRLNFERGNAVGVLLKLADTQQFLFVNQFRYAPHKNGDDGWIDEIVAGTLRDEKPEQCAAREVLEETGFKLDKLFLLGNFYVSPGGSCEKIFLYYGLTTSAGKMHEGGGVDIEHENICLKYYKRAELRRLLKQNYFVDAKTIIAIQYYFLNESIIQQVASK